jgi:5-(carboxyamino)imidazole ribonucleotide mutase
MFVFAREVEERGVRVVVAGAGGAAHLPGMVASITRLPVVGVPVALEGKTLQGIDSLYSIVQMPQGVPVATMAVNGAANAGLFAIRILALHDAGLRARLIKFHDGLEEFVHEKDTKVRKQFMAEDDFED